MLRLAVYVLFMIAWGLVAFGVIRALFMLWKSDRRMATLTAFAVAGAFVLGSIGPISSYLGPPRESAPAVAVAPAAPAVAPPVTTAVAPTAPSVAARVVTCPATAQIGKIPGKGFVDMAAIGSDPGKPVVSLVGPLAVPAGSSLQLTGWGALAAGPGSAICAFQDGRNIPATVTYGIARPDVAAATGNPANTGAGFSVTVAATPGQHTIRVGVLETNGRLADLLPTVVPVTTR